MMTRNRKLLDLAHGLPCTFTFPHVCQGQIVPCHANWQVLGRGFSFKSDDIFFAAGCREAHDMVDGRKPGLEGESRWWEWLRAHVATMRLLWERGLVRVK